MKLTRSICAALVTVLLCGCATRGAGYVPLVDLQNRPDGKYAQDLADCQGFAKQRAYAQDALAVGAIVGGILGAVLMPRGLRNEGAAFGAAVGGLGAADGAHNTQESIIKRCLAGRGYNVLN